MKTTAEPKSKSYVIDAQRACETHRFTKRDLYKDAEGTVFATLTCAECGYGAGKRLDYDPAESKQQYLGLLTMGWVFHYPVPLFDTESTVASCKEVETATA